MAKKSVLKQPGLVFYRPAVDDVLKRGDIAEMKALITGAKAAKTRFKDFDGLITRLQTAVKKVQERR
jgi:hypothetical protein